MSEAVLGRKLEDIISTMSEHVRNTTISSSSTPHQMSINFSEPEISGSTRVLEENLESKCSSNSSSSWETWISTSSMESSYYSTTSSEERYYSPSSQTENPKITSDDSSTNEPLSSLEDEKHLNTFRHTSCSNVCDVTSPNVSEKSRIASMPYENKIPTSTSESVDDKIAPKLHNIYDTPFSHNKYYGFCAETEKQFKEKADKDYKAFLNQFQSVSLPSQLDLEIKSLEQMINNIELQLPMLKSLLKRLKQAKLSGLLSNLLDKQEYYEPSVRDCFREKSEISESFDITKLVDLGFLYSAFDEKICKVGKSAENITEKLQGEDLSSAKYDESLPVLPEQLQSSESMKPKECSPMGQLLIGDEWEFEYPHLCLTPASKQCSALCPDKIDPSQYICHGSEEPRNENVESEEWPDLRRSKRISSNNSTSHNASSIKKNGKDFLPLITNKKECHRCLPCFCFCVEAVDTSDKGSSCIPGVPTKPTSKASGKQPLKGAKRADFYMMKCEDRKRYNLRSSERKHRRCDSL